MKHLTVLTVFAAVALLSCSGGEGPTGVAPVKYWDIAFESPDAVITGIDMVSETSGWACGYRFNEISGASDGLIYHYDGETWKVALFVPAETGIRFKGIDFLSDTEGWAVGMRDGGGSGPVVLQYDGAAWSEIPVEGLNGGELNFVTAFGPADIWLCDGHASYHFDGAVWTPFPITEIGEITGWCFPAPEIGWAVDYRSGYCYRWDAAAFAWTLEPYPLYNVTAFYFLPDGSGYYADYQNVPPVGARANIYKRVPGDVITYERVFSSNQDRVVTACAFYIPDYFLFAGPNAAYEVTGDKVEPAGYVPAGGLGGVRALSAAAPKDVWGVQSQNPYTGPSFIVHK